LKERLNKGVYGDIYNIPFKEFDEVLEMERDDAVLEEEDDEVSIVLNTCKLVYCLFSLFTSCVICVHLIT
jgi:hypothetical protein